MCRDGTDENAIHETHHFKFSAIVQLYKKKRTHIQQTHACVFPFTHSPSCVFPLLRAAPASSLIIMSPLTTRPNNKNKHPGIVDLSPQRRTHTQKRADDETAAEEKQAKRDAHKAGIRRLAAAEEHAMQKMKAVMGPELGPRASGQTTHEASTTANSLGVGTGKNVYTVDGKDILIYLRG
jgi:hypothetical protein